MGIQAISGRYRSNTNRLCHGLLRPAWIHIPMTPLQTLAPVDPESQPQKKQG